VLLMRRSVADKLVTLSNVGSEFGDDVIGAEAGPDQSVAMELLEPLGIADISLSTRNIFGVPRIYEKDLNPCVNQYLVQWNPINTSGFHGNGVDANCQKPLSECDQIASEA
jgi:hypothetical protein